MFRIPVIHVKEQDHPRTAKTVCSFIAYIPLLITLFVFKCSYSDHKSAAATWTWLYPLPQVRVTSQADRLGAEVMGKPRVNLEKE